MRLSWLMVCMLFIVGKPVLADTSSIPTNNVGDSLENIGVKILDVPLDLIAPKDGESVSSPLKIKFATLGEKAEAASPSLNIFPLYGQEQSEIPYDAIFLKQNVTEVTVNLPPGNYALVSRSLTTRADKTVKISVMPKGGNNLTVFRLLGMRDFGVPAEYLSNKCPAVEFFFRSQRVTAKIFEQNLRKLMQEQNILTPLKINNNEGSIEFVNCESARLLNSYFLNTINAYGYADLSADAILKGSRPERLAFLLGAYLRKGNDLQYSFASQKSSEMIVKILKSVGVKNVIINQDPQCSVCESGGKWYVSFALNDDLAKMIVEADDLTNSAASVLESTPNWGKTTSETSH